MAIVKNKNDNNRNPNLVMFEMFRVEGVLKKRNKKIKLEPKRNIAEHHSIG